MNKGYFKGKFCDANKIAIPLDSVGFNRGYAAFDFLKVVNNRAFRPEDHLRRFFKSMKLMSLEIDESFEELESIIIELSCSAEVSLFGLKLFAAPINEPFSGQDPFRAELALVPVPLSEFSKELYLNGGKLNLFEYERYMPDVKSINYMPSIFWQVHLNTGAFLEPLFHWNGEVRETARSNVFCRISDSIFTHKKGVLHGITRTVVLELLQSTAYYVDEASISLSDLKKADEVFITSTTKGVLPITRIDDFQIANGKVGELSKSLNDSYRQLLISQ